MRESSQISSTPRAPGNSEETDRKKVIHPKVASSRILTIRVLCVRLQIAVSSLVFSIRSSLAFSAACFAAAVLDLAFVRDFCVSEGRSQD
jgi:hypothetical protein